MSKIHPRKELENRAFGEALVWFRDWHHRHDLTTSEVLLFLARTSTDLAYHAVESERSKEGKSDSRRLDRGAIGKD